MTHVWQWKDQAKAPLQGWFLPTGLSQAVETNGIRADYFLQYCDSISSGFVANINTKMASGWDLGFFNDLTGKSVGHLWSDYKAKYVASS
ncbi:hypothetical protein SUGI_0472660 [Cryptomeria japonica]|nr:hypothetical protein SUGI_0472660 [Cryptomeria japonica]